MYSASTSGSSSILLGALLLLTISLRLGFCTATATETATTPEEANEVTSNGLLDLCYGPPLPLQGRICESQRAVINFKRVTYRVSLLKDKKSHLNKNSSSGEVKKSYVCCDGRGTNKNQEFWVPLGCGGAGEGFSRTIYFDGVIGFPAIRCTGYPEGVFVQWSH